jgi:hypothetical protein
MSVGALLWILKLSFLNLQGSLILIVVGKVEKLMNSQKQAERGRQNNFFIFPRTCVKTIMNYGEGF